MKMSIGKTLYVSNISEMISLITLSIQFGVSYQYIKYKREHFLLFFKSKMQSILCLLGISCQSVIQVCGIELIDKIKLVAIHVFVAHSSPAKFHTFPKGHTSTFSEHPISMCYGKGQGIFLLIFKSRRTLKGAQSLSLNHPGAMPMPRHLSTSHLICTY